MRMHLPDFLMQTIHHLTKRRIVSLFMIYGIVKLSVLSLYRLL